MLSITKITQHQQKWGQAYTGHRYDTWYIICMRLCWWWEYVWGRIMMSQAFWQRIRKPQHYDASDWPNSRTRNFQSWTIRHPASIWYAGLITVTLEMISKTKRNPNQLFNLYRFSVTLFTFKVFTVITTCSQTITIAGLKFSALETCQCMASKSMSYETTSAHTQEYIHPPQDSSILVSHCPITGSCSTINTNLTP